MGGAIGGAMGGAVGEAVVGAVGGATGGVIGEGSHITSSSLRHRCTLTTVSTSQGTMVLRSMSSQETPSSSLAREQTSFNICT